MSRFFIRRPIVAMVIAILTVLVGAIVVAELPVAQFPQIAPPEVQIRATYVGADSQTIEQSVATPIEQQMSGVDNLNYMYSLNAGSSGMGKRVRRRRSVTSGRRSRNQIAGPGRRPVCRILHLPRGPACCGIRRAESAQRVSASA
jgi:AcrB/AcrD/AcrF family